MHDVKASPSYTILFNEVIGLRLTLGLKLASAKVGSVYESTTNPLASKTLFIE